MLSLHVHNYFFFVEYCIYNIIFAFSIFKELTELWFDEYEGTEVDTSLGPESSSVRLIRVYVMFLFTWQSMFRVSDAGMNILFLFIAVILSLIVSFLPVENLERFIQLLPKNTAAAKKLIGNVQAVLSVIRYIHCKYVRLLSQTKLSAQDVVPISRSLIIHILYRECLVILNY